MYHSSSKFIPKPIIHTFSATMKGESKELDIQDYLNGVENDVGGAILENREVCTWIYPKE